MGVSSAAFVALANSQAGDRYVYGAKEPASDPDPKAHGGAFDCSGLVTWDLRHLGVPFPDGSAQQLEYCQRHGTVIPVDLAERTAGALLFLGPGGSEHVVISRGDGTTIEARGAAWGVGSWSVYRDAWTAAAKVPGLDYGPHTPPPHPSRYAFVTRLQTAVGVTVDGDWGPVTDRAVVRWRGHTGPTVGRIQEVLCTLVPDLAVDGDWGRRTEAAYALARHAFYGQYA